LENPYFLQPSINKFLLPSEGIVKLSELAEPKVQRIEAANMTNEKILVFEGLIFDGLRQARMASSDQILEPGAKALLEVVCVEQGRWGDEFDGEVIQRAPLSVIASLRQGLQSTTSQRLVWSAVEKHQLRSQSLATTSLKYIMDSYRNSQSWLPFHELKRFELSKNTNGLAISVAGEPLLVEFFSSPSICGRQFKSIVESVLWDLNELEVIKTSNRNLLDFLDATSQMYEIDADPSFTRVNEEISFRSLRFSQMRNPVHVFAINHSNPIFGERVI
jgi:hypothetical protein